MKNTSLCNTLFAGVFLLAVAMTAQADAYRQGMDAFRAGDYAAALRNFQQAEREGLRSTTLYYNLGATHYRLGEYEESARAFGRVVDDVQWGALAEYNLGLIAERQGEATAARDHYRAAQRKAGTTRVRELAASRLAALDGAPQAVLPRWVTYLSAALGYDDNATLSGDDDLSPSKKSDVFLEVIASVNGYLHGDRSDGLRLNLGFYSRNHDDVSEFDITGVSAGLFLDRQSAVWQWSAGASVNNYWVDGGQYSTGAGLRLQAMRPLGDLRLHLVEQLDYIDGDSDYDWITGWRNRIDVSIRGSATAGDWRLGYLNEYNDRDDFSQGAQFVSFSPVRHAIYGQVSRAVNRQLTAVGRLEYRNSRYRRANRELDAQGNLSSRRRDDDRLQASLLLRYSPGAAYSVFAEYRYTDNDSNIDRFSYDSNQLMLGVDAVF